jgi:hypothetical protein
MEALLILGFLLGLAILAPRFGHDSREHLASAEEAFARQGFTWGSTTPARKRASLYRLRHLAALLQDSRLRRAQRCVHAWSRAYRDVPRH